MVVPSDFTITLNTEEQNHFDRLLAEKDALRKIISSTPSVLIFEASFTGEAFTDNLPIGYQPKRTSDQNKSAVKLFNAFAKALSNRWRLNAHIGFICKVDWKASYLSDDHLRPHILAILFSNKALDHESIAGWWGQKPEDANDGDRYRPSYQIGRCRCYPFGEVLLKDIAIEGLIKELVYTQNGIQNQSDWFVSNNFYCFVPGYRPEAVLTDKEKIRHQKRVLKRHHEGNPRPWEREKGKQLMKESNGGKKVRRLQLKRIPGDDLYCNRLAGKRQGKKAKTS